MKLIRFADLTPKPWKNGGGTTTEIAVSPEGAGFDDFDWRLSVAEVASDGPFSVFPEIDRTLTLIEGNGLTMAIAGREAVTLTTTAAPLAFPGDVPVSASLVDGPIRDFNVMSRRGRFSHEVQRHLLAAGALTLAPHKLLVALGAGPIRLGDTNTALAFGDVVIFEADDAGSIVGALPVLLVTLRPTSIG
ncbi:HutD/Ves family protein [Labrys neptuniae]